MNKIRSFAATALAALVLLIFAAPAFAGITFSTRGEAKVGNLILGGTTLTATGAEVNSLADQAASMVQVSTPATGSVAIGFTFHNAAGTAIGSQRTLVGYVSTSAGAQSSAVTSLATLTNGAITQLVTGKDVLATTTSAGLLGCTLTASAGTYYLSFVLPDGKVITSSALVVH